MWTIIILLLLYCDENWCVLKSKAVKSLTERLEFREGASSKQLVLVNVVGYESNEFM